MTDHSAALAMREKATGILRAEISRMASSYVGSVSLELLVDKIAALPLPDEPAPGADALAVAAKLRWLCAPLAETMDDKRRLDEFVACGALAANMLTVSRAPASVDVLGLLERADKALCKYDDYVRAKKVQRALTAAIAQLQRGTE